MFRTKWGVGLFFVCLLPSLIRLAMLLIMFGVIQFGPLSLRNRMSGRASSEVAMLDPRTADFYVEPVLQVMPGMVFALLLTTLVVARAVAKDRATNALELYWTRGITPWTYVLAKWLGTLLMVSVVTVLAPLALWLTAVFLADDWTLASNSWWPVVKGLGGLLVATSTWTALGILVSVACATPSTAMVLWTMLLVGSSALAVALSTTLHEPQLRSTLSVWHAGGVVARAIAGIPQRQVSVGGALAVLAILFGMLLLRARSRLRLSEAVA